MSKTNKKINKDSVRDKRLYGRQTEAERKAEYKKHLNSYFKHFPVSVYKVEFYDVFLEAQLSDYSKWLNTQKNPDKLDWPENLKHSLKSPDFKKAFNTILHTNLKHIASTASSGSLHTSIAKYMLTNFDIEKYVTNPAEELSKFTKWFMKEENFDNPEVSASIVEQQCKALLYRAYHNTNYLAKNLNQELYTKIKFPAWLTPLCDCKFSKSTILSRFVLPQTWKHLAKTNKSLRSTIPSEEVLKNAANMVGQEWFDDFEKVMNTYFDPKANKSKKPKRNSKRREKEGK